MNASWRDNTGAVMIEWALVVTGCVIGFFIFLDTVAMITDYMVLNSIIREGARTLGAQAALEASSYTDLIPTADELAACEKVQTTAYPCGHGLVHSRIRYVISNLSWHIDPASVSITTTYHPAGAGASADEDSVVVEIRARFSGYMLSNFPLVLSRQGPYLY
jgi:hypothetical protein